MQLNYQKIIQLHFARDRVNVSEIKVLGQQPFNIYIYFLF